MPSRRFQFVYEVVDQRPVFFMCAVIRQATERNLNLLDVLGNSIVSHNVKGHDLIQLEGTLRLSDAQAQ